MDGDESSQIYIYLLPKSVKLIEVNSIFLIHSQSAQYNRLQGVPKLVFQR